MPHPDALYHWRARVQGLFPALAPHHARDLADYSFGAALARTCGLTQVVAYLAGYLAVGAHALRARLRELYLPAAAQRGAARSAFDHAVCFGPLLRWAAAGQPGKRLALALDPTCLTDRFRVLCAAVRYRGGGLPVAWAVQQAGQQGSWNDVWADLLGRLREALGDGWSVLVLTDRGLESAALFRAVTALGWHPLMRAKAAGHFRPGGWHHGHRMGAFAAAAGRRWAGAGVAYPSGERLACALLAVWEAGHAEPWLVLTDLPAAAADPAWYAWRMWAEQGFKAVKSGAWQWQQTRMADPARAARLWAVLAVATLWMTEVGGAAEPAALPPLPARPRPLRLVRAGLVLLAVALARQEPLPQGRLRPHDWPPRGWEPDPLTEADLDQS
jgi:Transposase DDE domain